MDRTATAGTPALETTMTDGRRWTALTVLLIPVALILISVTSANVALPAIREGLHASDTALSLVLTAYALAFGLVLVPAGRFGDRRSHKQVFIVGVLVFTAAIAWCGFAGDEVQLVIARVFAGIGGGIALTPVAALIQVLFQGPERAKPFAIMGAVFGVATAIGPLVGGLLVTVGTDLGWRLTFLVNVPFGVAAALLAAFLVPRDRSSGAVGGDSIGMVLLTAGVAALMLPFTLGGGLDLAGGVLLAVGVLLLVGFALLERSRDSRGLATIVPPRMFARRAFPVGLATMFLGFGSFTASFLVLALLWQDGLGRTALESGVLILPYAIASVIGGGLSARVWERIGQRTVAIGLAAIAVGLGAVGTILLTLPTGSITAWVLAAPLASAGLGAGLFVGPNTNLAVQSIDRRDVGVASGLLGTAQRSGTALGVGAAAAVLASAGPGAEYLHTAAGAAYLTAGFALAALLVALTAGLVPVRRV
ncbi:MFS transporter [Leucobacter weissii]|uniref:MFS transporter n=1 Tax=Leucobacter weissii TaxID=1983706 RepID=A0A939SAR5_9MICO|nr:MFS transporter [Leucobacter weissii]MBO1902232.1 MFS transporter [Leucobacter weissii]